MDPYRANEFVSEVKQMFSGPQDLNSPKSTSTSPGADTVFSEGNEHSFESVSSLPTPLKQPRFASDDTIDSDRATLNPLTTASSIQSKPTKFVAPNDIPEWSTKDYRFNKIRPTVKSEEADPGVTAIPLRGPSAPFENRSRSISRASPTISTMYKQSVGGVTDDDDTDDSTSRTASVSKPACAACRIKKRRCIHASGVMTQGYEKRLRSGSGLMPKMEERGDIDMKLKIKTEPSENRIKKDGTPYVRVPHDHSKGLSMTRSAVDYRERKVIQQQYQDRFAALLDEDIVSQVEGEGGITPLGRIFKAGVRMLERVQIERKGFVESMREPQISGIAEYSIDGARQETGATVQDLGAFKAELQALLDGWS